MFATGYFKVFIEAYRRKLIMHVHWMCIILVKAPQYSQSVFYLQSSIAVSINVVPIVFGSFLAYSVNQFQ